jgi:transposase InsO family protein
MEIGGWKLPKHARRRTGRAHTGQIHREISNERWCSDALEIACWNVEYVQIAFALDCHDRECLAWVAVPGELRGSAISVDPLFRFARI